MMKMKNMKEKSHKGCKGKVIGDGIISLELVSS